ncbi:MAG: CoA-binding protein [Lachnospiraceae bacterium]|nr:CoA-binding protein [Candidatus Darwinimomas equi]
MNLKQFFNPKTIAVIGANESEGFGGAVVKRLEKAIDDSGRVFYVNKKRETLNGKPCYNSIGDIPCDIDLMVIATNKHTVIDLLYEGAKKNVKSAVVFASGFSETHFDEDKELEKELLRVSRELNIDILGPNCAGFVNFVNGIDAFAFLSEDRDRKGSIGFVSQSGMISLSLMDNQNTLFSYNISIGNACAIKLSDVIDFLIDDEQTRVIGMYIDAIKDESLQDFETSLKKAYEKNKRVALIKVGSNDKSRLIARNHTGSSESFSDDEFMSLLKKYNVIRADDLEELIYILTSLSNMNLPDNFSHFASLNLSGGETALISESADAFKGIEFPDFSKELADYLKDKLPSYANISNPLDMTVTLSYDADAFSEALVKVMQEDTIDAVLIGYTLLCNIDDPCIYYMLEGIKKTKDILKEKMKPIFIISFMSNTRNQKCLEELLKNGIVCLPSTKYAFSILNKLQKSWFSELE